MTLEPILDPREFKAWLSMSEKKKRRVFDTAFSLLETVAKKQLRYIDQWKLVQDDEKESAHIYVFGTVENFWENISLARELGRGSYANFAHYPARACMEMFLQFFHFCRQDERSRNRIAIVELLRPSVRFYFREKREGGNGRQYKEFYDRSSKELGLPENIDEADEEKLERSLRPFPSVQKLCNEYHAQNPKEAKILYFLYQYLCESVHGKVFARFLRKQAADFEEYRRAMMMLYLFCKDILVITDKEYLERRFQSDVEDVIKRTDALIKNSVNRSGIKARMLDTLRLLGIVKLQR